MSRIAPLPVEELPEATRRSLAFAQELMGFTPNDVLTMARWPELLAAVEPLVAVIYAPGEVDPVLKRMVATLVSGVAGCRYCQAHTAHGAVKLVGGDAAKIAAAWEFASSPLFTAAERVALNFAFHAAQQPGAATDDHFSALREHYSERAILELVAMISLFGFLNRWNDTLATPLEDKPLAFAQANLSPEHWDAGKHAR
jgi:uncharacterized peroxidase-related enzyme